MRAETATPKPQALTTHPNPVFILAPARSYSTVSVALLAGHPMIFGFPELLLFTRETVREVLDEAVFGSHLAPGTAMIKLSGITRSVAQIHDGTQSRDALVRAYTWLRKRENWSGVDLLGYLFSAVSPMIGLEKSPDTSNAPASLARCISAFPEARFIHLIRHPVDTQRSMHEHVPMHSRPDDRSVLERSVQAASAWYLSHLRIRKALATLPPGRSLTVRAEDLLGDDRATLRHVFAWLGLETDDSIVEAATHTERWCFVGTGVKQGLYGGDYKFMHTPSLRHIPPPGPLAFPQEWRLPEALRSKMIELALQFGYRTDGEVRETADER